MYPKRAVLAISFVLQGLLFLMVGQGGEWYYGMMQSGLWYFCTCFVLVGTI
jgi:hypothetical protein